MMNLARLSMRCLSAAIVGIALTLGLPLASPAEEPAFSFTWLTDLHLDASRLDAIAEALDYVDAQLKPDFVLITGDNCAHDGDTPETRPDDSRAVKRQKFFKHFLAEHLQAPTVVIPGDNWPEGFEEVFGPAQYAFDYGGVRLVMLTPDRTLRHTKKEGLSEFLPDTWEWIRTELTTPRDMPVVVAIHETVFPPTFLDAERLGTLLREQSGVVACLQGHLHVDITVQRGQQIYLTGASLGKSEPPSLKHLTVYPDRIVMKNILRRESPVRFEPIEGETVIPIPEPLRGAVHRPEEPGKWMHYSCVPVHAPVTAPELTDRFGELTTMMRRFLVEETRQRWNKR